MFSSKFLQNSKFLQHSYLIIKLSAVTTKNVSTAEVLQPVPLAYATYETTDTPSQSDPGPLLIVHGLFGSKGNWNSLSKVYLQKTNPKRKVIAVDTRNHGDSPHSDNHSYEHLALDIKALMHQLYIKKVVLLGHSMGGRAAMLFALRYPELVEKLIVGDISPVQNSPNMKTILMLISALKNVALPKNVALSSARMNVDQQLSSIIVDKGLRAFLLTNLVQKPDGNYAWRMNIDVLEANYDKISRFPKVANAVYDGPVLFVGGGASDFLRRDDHQHIRKLFPKAEFKYIDGAGHFVHSEKPAEFLQVTVDFINNDNNKS